MNKITCADLSYTDKNVAQYQCGTEVNSKVAFWMANYSSLKTAFSLTDHTQLIIIITRPHYC